MALEAIFTEACNSMVSVPQAQYVEARASRDKTSKAVVVRTALDLLMEREPLDMGGDPGETVSPTQ